MSETVPSAVEKHIVQWQRNRELIGKLETAYTEWIITVTFYCALHAVESLFQADGVPACSSHTARRQCLMQGSRYQAIFKPYERLYNAAYVARYSADPTRWIPGVQTHQKLIVEGLYPIEKSVRKLLAGLKKPIAFPEHTAVHLHP